MSINSESVKMEDVVQRLMYQLNLKNKLELATKLNLTKQSLSMPIARNSLGTLVEKLVELGLVVSSDSLIYDIDSSHLKNHLEERKQAEINELERRLKILKSK